MSEPHPETIKEREAFEEWGRRELGYSLIDLSYSDNDVDYKWPDVQSRWRAFQAGAAWAARGAAEGGEDDGK